MKRLLCLFLCSLLLLAAPVSICAQDADNGFLYKVISHGYASITGYTGGESEVIVLSEIKGHSVSHRLCKTGKRDTSCRAEQSQRTVQRLCLPA